MTTTLAQLALVAVIVFVAYPLWLCRAVWACLANPARAWRLLIAADQLANAAFNGHEDETISERAARAQRQGTPWACVLCKFLDNFDKNHCGKSLKENDR